MDFDIEAVLMGAGALITGAGVVGGMAGGVFVALIRRRGDVQVAGISKPHEMTEADTHQLDANTEAFRAFIGEARAELNRLKGELDECNEKHRVAAELADERDAAAQARIAELQGQVHHLEAHVAALQAEIARPAHARTRVTDKENPPT